VEDVIQPYSLPRPTHVVFSSPPRSPNANSRASPAPLTVSPALAIPGTLLASSSFPTPASDYGYVNDDNGEERAQVSSPFPDEEVEDSETEKMSVPEEGTQNRNSRRVRRIPKSMAALAAEVAEEAQQAMTAVDVAAAPQLNGGGEEATSTHARISRTATPRTRARAKTEPESESRTRTRTRTRTRATTKAGVKTTTAGTLSRKRARTQDDDGGNESASDRFDSESGSGGEEHVSSSGKPRVAKRARKHRQGSRTDVMDGDGGGLAPAPPSGRVLRTRKGRSPAQLAQEHEQELAVQRALAG
jgi:hypothetical protein